MPDRSRSAFAASKLARMERTYYLSAGRALRTPLFRISCLVRCPSREVFRRARFEEISPQDHTEGVFGEIVCCIAPSTLVALSKESSPFR